MDLTDDEISIDVNIEQLLKQLLFIEEEMKCNV